MVRHKDQPEAFDPYDLGARRSDPELGAFEPLPPNPRTVTTNKLLGLFVLVVVAVGLFRTGQDGGRVPAAGSCTRPTFHVSATTVASGAVLSWSVSGDADSSVVFGIDTSTRPVSTQTGLLDGPVRLAGCKALGTLRLAVPAGPHVLSVYIEPRSGAALLLGTQKVTVT